MLVGMENEAAKTERIRRSRAEIEELVAIYRSSGQRQREFCQQQGIGLSTLQNYLRREGDCAFRSAARTASFHRFGPETPRDTKGQSPLPKSSGAGRIAASVL
jgi:hypothetical protein